MKHIKTSIKDYLKEGTYYHGTPLPKDNPTIDKFVSKKGYRSNAYTGLREVKSPWIFFTENESMARTYGAEKTDGLYHDKGNFNYTNFVLTYQIDESKLNILDLAKDNYEFVLEDIDIKLYEYFGMGMYEQEDMWELLDDEEISKHIVEKGFDSVKLIENIGSYSGTSLAIHISKVNNVAEKKAIEPGIKNN